MVFVRITTTTGKVEIPEGPIKEAKLTFLQKIVNKVEEFSISPSLIRNLDQANSNYVSVVKTTMAIKDSPSILIVGLSDKRKLTATLAITLNGTYIHLKRTYGRNTN